MYSNTCMSATCAGMATRFLCWSQVELLLDCTLESAPPSKRPHSRSATNHVSDEPTPTSLSQCAPTAMRETATATPHDSTATQTAKDAHFELSNRNARKQAKKGRSDQFTL